MVKIVLSAQLLRVSKGCVKDVLAMCYTRVNT